MKVKKILVMGVSGCGKSLIGKEIADKLSLPFYDGDDYHPVLPQYAGFILIASVWAGSILS